MKIFYSSALASSLREVNLSDQWVTLSDGSLQCGCFNESYATRDEKQEMQSFFKLSTSTCMTIVAAGDSMIGADINDGDMLVIDPYELPTEGCIVAVCYRGMYTVKYYSYDEVHRVLTLVPANPEFQPIVLEGEALADVVIKGVVKYSISSKVRASRRELRERIEESHQMEGLRSIEQQTLKAGYMDADMEWTDRATNEFKAVWVDLVCDKLGIADRWRWATERWGLSKLRVSFNNALNSPRYDVYSDIVKGFM